MTNPYLLTSLGAAAAISFSCLGSAVSSCVAASYAMAMKGWACHIPIIVSGVLAVYGLIIGALLVSKLRGNASHDSVMGDWEGYANLAAGLAVGLPCYVSGMSLAGFLTDSLYNDDEYCDLYDDDDGNNNRAITPKMYQSLLPAGTVRNTTSASRSQPRSLKNPRPVTMKFVLMLTFLEALGLYGLIVALLLIG